MRLTLALLAVLASGGTTVHEYAAFDGRRVAPGLHVRGTRHGRCGSSSTVDGRPFSWRCFSGRFVFDPCFAASRSGGRIVVCPDRPWSRHVVVLRLGRPTGVWQHYRRRTDYPWGIRTTTGRSCFSLAASATGSVAGRAITYECDGGGLLAGYVHRDKAQWTIRFAPAATAHRTEKVGITDVWN
jgi:hypothetical protein